MIKARQFSEYKFGTSLNLIKPTTNGTIIVNTANDTLFKTIGIFFIMFIIKESVYIYNTIVNAIIVNRRRRVKPSVLFAKLFEVSLSKTAIPKKSMK